MTHALRLAAALFGALLITLPIRTAGAFTPTSCDPPQTWNYGVMFGEYLSQLPTRSYPYWFGRPPLAATIVIDDACDFYYASVPSANELRFYSMRSEVKGTVPVGPNPYGFDFTPGARRAASGGTTGGTGQIYVANNGEKTLSVIDLATGQSSKINVPLSDFGNQRPQYVAVTTEGTVLIATDAGGDKIRLLHYSPASGMFRDRTSEIPGTITRAVLRPSTDRSAIEGISNGTTAYSYVAATDRFVAAPPLFYNSRETGISILTANRALRYSTSPRLLSSDKTLAVQNARTGAVIARLRSSGMPMAIPNAADLSKDGRFAALIDETGVTLIDVQPSLPMRVTAYPSTVARSVLRIHNAGAAAGTLRIKVQNAGNAETLGTWTTPEIPGGASVQYHLATLEGDLGIVNKPGLYSLTVSPPPGFFGSLQHLIWQPETATITNSTSCNYDAAPTTPQRSATQGTDPHQLAGVHSSVFGDYPSSVVVTRWETADVPPASVTLAVYDGRNGVKLGDYTTAAIPGKGHKKIAVTEIEAALRLAPHPSQQYYVIIAPATFKGHLQHLMESRPTGISTDVTASCPLNSHLPITQSLSFPEGPVYGTVDIGDVNSTAQSDVVSFFHFTNETSVTRTVGVDLNYQLADGSMATRLWTSPTIPAFGQLQVLVDTIEKQSGASFDKPAKYTAAVRMQFQGSVQHYVWRPAEQSLTNASTCSASAPQSATRLTAVHSSMYDVDYPSAVLVHNRSPIATSALIDLFGTNGQPLGRYKTESLASGASLAIPIAQIEKAIGIRPSWDVPRYTVIASQETYHYLGNWIALQHVMSNRSDGRVDDMTKACRPHLVVTPGFPPIY